MMSREAYYNQWGWESFPKQPENSSSTGGWKKTLGYYYSLIKLTIQLTILFLWTLTLICLRSTVAHPPINQMHVLTLALVKDYTCGSGNSSSLNTPTPIEAPFRTFGFVARFWRSIFTY